MTKTQKIVYYVLLVIVSLMFLMSAWFKLTGDAMSVAGFAKAHLPVWFMYLVGIIEVVGAIGLWVPRFQKWAVHGLGTIMIGAVVVTIFFDSPAMAIVPAVFAVVLWYIGKLGAKSAAPMSSAPQM